MSKTRSSRYMEKVLDTSLPPDNTKAGIHDPVTAQKPALTRCCSIALQLSSLTGKLDTSKGDQSTLSRERKEPPLAVGTGVYFQNLCSTSSLDSNCDIRDLENLFKLATVACELEVSIKHFQLVKKRRTPRKVLWINGSSSFTNGSCRNKIVGAGAPDVAKRQRTENLTTGHHSQPSWLERSAQNTSAFPLKRSCTNNRSTSNTVILKFVSQHGTVGKKIMACPPKSSRINFDKVANGNKRVSCVLSKRRARRMPGKDTRVQGLAKRILQFVGDGSTAEKFIRGAFGNNPDTSKALRLLLTQHKVYRVGDGGRGKAFLYVASPAGLRELEELKNHDVITTDDNSAKSHPLDHHEDVLQTSLQAIPSPLKNAHDGRLSPRCAFRDVTNCLPEPKIGQNVLHTVLGNNMERFG